VKHKISTGVLLFKEKKLLLVKHVDPKNGFTWWVPPGGGLKGEESIFEAAKREVMEETGLNANIGRIVYIRQLIYKQAESNVLTIYMLADAAKGKLTIANLNEEDLDSKYIKEVKYFSEEEIKNITVFPEICKDELWKDYKQGFPEIRFIGVSHD
jgi:ADP-ribose pyrophosphatase YjhB (NUDIX family)